MMGRYFYHQHIRRAVTVFGSLFNNISIAKRDGSGNITQSIKVPLSYGPTQKFLARIKAEADLTDPRLAIKLPRMSFEITNIAYDSSTQLQKRLTRCLPQTDGKSRDTVFFPTKYDLSFELSILAKHTDDALQILEQIIPYFQPDYTVTVNEVGNRFKADMPFVLTGITMNDDYEGDFTNRRSIIYTLTFDSKINFYGPIDENRNVIRSTRTSIADTDMPSSGNPYNAQTLTITPVDATENDPFTIDADFDVDVPNEFILGADSVTGNFTIGESVIGNTSGAVGILKSFDGSTAVIAVPDDNFVINETVVGGTSQASFVVSSVEQVWNAL
jgi:hypothetical protein